MRKELSQHEPVLPTASDPEIPPGTTFLGLPRTTAVRVDLLEGAEPQTPAQLLDAGLAADQAWRHERVAEVRRKARHLDRHEVLAIRGGVIAGLLELLTLLSIGLFIGTSNALLGTGVLFAGAAIPLLLTFTGAAIPILRWRRRRVLNAAVRDGIEPGVLAQVRQGPAATELRESAMADPRAEELQRKLNRSYRDERDFGEIYLWGGYAALLTWGLLALAAGLVGLADWIGGDTYNLLSQLMNLVVLTLVVIVCVVVAFTLFILPIVAPMSAYQWYRRKLLLREAERLGFDLYDPASYFDEQAPGTA